MGANLKSSRRLNRLASFLVPGAMLASPALADPALMPLPSHAVFSSATLPISGRFAVRQSGCPVPLLDHAIDRFESGIARRTALAQPDAKSVMLTITCASADPTSSGSLESYRLVIDGQGITMTAQSPVGALRGLATLRQLVVPMGAGYAFAGATIDDAPRFAWRGLMIDTVRHFVSIATLQRQLDAMEQVKLNVLHLHLSDNEAFRVQSFVFPKLTPIASRGQYYTQDEIRGLVRYAADRGIRIIPEIGLPGHTKAILTAYPELAAGAADAVAASPSPVLNPALPQTYRFIDRLFAEMTTLFPDAQFHTGGDEVVGDAWDHDPRIDSFKQAHGLATNAALKSYFEARVHATLHRYGKTMIGWDEIAQGHLPSDVIVQTWRSSKQAAHATSLGHRVIVSAGYYLDNLDDAALHYAVDPLDPAAFGISAGNMAKLRRVPVFGNFITDGIALDPVAPLTPGQQALVIGAEAPLWTELITDEMVDGRFWPRAAALAERFWSPATVRDGNDMYRRLAIVQDGLRIVGLEDQANRQRMLARLTPGDTAPVETFVDLLKTARNASYLRPLMAMITGDKTLAAAPRTFDRLGDAASTDSEVARRFNLDVDAFLKGERTLAPGLVARLTAWQANHTRFVEVARGRPILEAALPVSADIATLCEIGVTLVSAIDSGRSLDAETLMRARVLLDRQSKAKAAAATFWSGMITDNPLPVDDVLIAIAPAIDALSARAAGHR
jgi:hexosaminidase